MSDEYTRRRILFLAHFRCTLSKLWKRSQQLTGSQNHQKCSLSIYFNWTTDFDNNFVVGASKDDNKIAWSTTVDHNDRYNLKKKRRGKKKIRKKNATPCSVLRTAQFSALGSICSVVFVKYLQPIDDQFLVDSSILQNKRNCRFASTNWKIWTIALRFHPV